MSKAQITSSVTRIASRLSKKGIKGITEQIREAIAKIENYQATKEEESMIVEQFLFGDEPTEFNLTMIEPTTEAIEPVTDESVCVISEIPTVTTELATVSEGNSTEATETLAAIEEEENKTPDSSIVVSEPTSVIFNQQVEAMQLTLQSAPSEIRQDLIAQYAEKQFNDVADLLAAKSQIDSTIRNYLNQELEKQQTEDTNYWLAVEQKFKENNQKEVAKRQQNFQSVLDNLKTKIREYSS